MLTPGRFVVALLVASIVIFFGSRRAWATEAPSERLLITQPIGGTLQFEPDPATGGLTLRHISPGQTEPGPATRPPWRQGDGERLFELFPRRMQVVVVRQKSDGRLFELYMEPEDGGGWLITRELRSEDVPFKVEAISFEADRQPIIETIDGSRQRLGAPRGVPQPTPRPTETAPKAKASTPKPSFAAAPARTRRSNVSNVESRFAAGPHFPIQRAVLPRVR